MLLTSAHIKQKHQKVNDLLFAWLLKNQPAPFRWLDIGAGHGYMSRILASLYGHRNFLHIDLESPYQDVVRMDGGALAFGDDSFDVAFMNFMLHHASDPRAVLREARRVAPIAIIQEDVDDGASGTREKIREHVGPAGSVLTDEQWLAMFTECGFALLHRVPHERQDYRDAGGYHVPRCLYVLSRA